MKTILIADEDTRVRNLVRLMFTEHMGYRVIDAPTGTDALIKSKEIKPDVVLVDVSLSNQSGYYVSKEIKNDPALGNTSVILFTSAFVAVSRRDALEAYADDVIMKPFDPGEMAGKVELLVNGFKKGAVESAPSAQADEISGDESPAQTEERFDGNVSEQGKPGVSSQLSEVYRSLAESFKHFRQTLMTYGDGFRLAVGKLREKKITLGLPVGATSLKIPSLDAGNKYSSIKLRLGTFLQTLAGNFRSVRKSLKNYAEDLAGRLYTLKKKSFSSGIRIKPVTFKVSLPDVGHPLVVLLGLGMVALVITSVVFADRRGKGVTAYSDGSKPSADHSRPDMSAGFGILFSAGGASGGMHKSGIPLTGVGETGKVSAKERTSDLQPRKDGSKDQKEPKEKSKKDRYLVKRGDTLSVIADRFNISVRDLRIVNDIRGDRIYAGEVLIIPKGVIKSEITGWDVLDAGGGSDGIKIIDWDLYVPWSGVAVLHHVFIENTSDVDFKSIKVKLYYYYDSNSDRIARGEATAILPITVPRKSKRIYLEEGVVLRGDFNVNSMYVKNGSIEVLEAVPQRYSAGYSLNR